MCSTDAENNFGAALFRDTTVCRSLVVFFRTKRFRRLSNRSVAVRFAFFFTPHTVVNEPAQT